MEIENKHKLDYLLKTFILCPFADNLVALIMSTILVSAIQLTKSNLLPEISFVLIYRKDASTPNTINKMFKCLKS